MSLSPCYRVEKWGSENRVVWQRLYIKKLLSHEPNSTFSPQTQALFPRRSYLVFSKSFGPSLGSFTQGKCKIDLLPMKICVLLLISILQFFFPKSLIAWRLQFSDSMWTTGMWKWSTYWSRNKIRVCSSDLFLHREQGCNRFFTFHYWYIF